MTFSDFGNALWIPSVSRAHSNGCNTGISTVGALIAIIAVHTGAAGSVFAAVAVCIVMNLTLLSLHLLCKVGARLLVGCGGIEVGGSRRRVSRFHVRW